MKAQVIVLAFISLSGINTSAEDRNPFVIDRRTFVSPFHGNTDANHGFQSIKSDNSHQHYQASSLNTDSSPFASIEGTQANGWSDGAIGVSSSPRQPSNLHKKESFCDVLRGTKYVAVVSRWNEDVTWTQSMPIKTLVYEHEKPNALYNVEVNKGSETSAYIQFILDHYDCLPKWTLFLHAHGRTASQGTSHAASRHHPTDPTRVASLIDVESVDR
jgi:hypothetical protein